MEVPFVDLLAGIRPHRDEYLARIAEVIDSAYFAGGPVVAQFERAFAAFCATEHAVAVASGTGALMLLLRAVGIGPGDEVITAPNSFFATAEAISHTGATPVFADVCRETLTIDPERVAERITERTRAVVPVHLFGQIAAMEPLEALCRERGLLLCEDAAQAHGAKRNRRRAGAIGLGAAFSFYPAKNLGAFGDGGAVTTDSDDIAGAVRALRDHGQVAKHHHLHIGYNARLAAIQCACLAVRLSHVDACTAARRRAAARYRDRLAGLAGVELVGEDPAGEAVYHLFVIRVPERDRVRAALAEAGVATAIHYPTPIHLQPAYRFLGYREGDFPVAERAAREMISLPMYPEISDRAIDYVVECVARAMARR